MIYFKKKETINLCYNPENGDKFPEYYAILCTDFNFPHFISLNNFGDIKKNHLIINFFTIIEIPKNSKIYLH